MSRSFRDSALTGFLVGNAVLDPVAAVVLVLTGYGPLAVIFAANWFLTLYVMFKDTMNVLQVVGPVYWITRDNASDTAPHISKAFMRQVDHPWHTGKGIQVRFRQWSFQVGLCRKNDVPESVGQYIPVGGRPLPDTPDMIGVWGENLEQEPGGETRAEARIEELERPSQKDGPA